MLPPRVRGAVLIVHGTLVPSRRHTVAEQSKSHRYSTNHQAVIDADTNSCLVAGLGEAGRSSGKSKIIYGQCLACRRSATLPPWRQRR